MTSAVRGVPAGITLPDRLLTGGGVEEIAGYLAELTAGHGPGPAHAAVKELFLRRVLARRAVAGVPRLLRDAAAAAGRDAQVEDDDVAAALLADGVYRAVAPHVWQDYLDVLVRLARRDPAVRDRLAALEPDLARSAALARAWIDLLLDGGVVGGVAARQPDARGAWLSRFVQLLTDLGPSHDRTPPPVPTRFAELVELLAPGAGAGPPVAGVRDIRYLDALVALGHPVEPIVYKDHWVCDLDGWLGESAHRRSDLAALAADPVVRPHLVALLVPRPGEPRARAEHLAGLPAMAPLVAEAERERVLGPLRRLGALGLPDWAEPLGELAEALRGDVPDGVAGEVAAFDPAPALGALLRAGLVDEFGWPALEAAVARVGPAHTLAGAWPEVVLHDRERALLVGRDGVLAEWALPDVGTPPGELPGVRYCAGELVVWRPGWVDGSASAAWTSAPGEVFDLDGGRHGSPGCEVTVALADGARTSGRGPALVVGARELPGHAPFSADGRAFWRKSGGSRPWEAFDPRTGRPLGPIAPAFPGEEPGVDRSDSWVLPIGSVDSPLGVRDGLTGLRVHIVDLRHQELESTDGGTARIPWPGTPRALLRWPGDPERRRVLVEGRGTPAAVRLLDPDGRVAAVVRPGAPGDFSAGTPFLPPPLFWHHLRARDPQGSAALRAVTDEAAGTLLAAAVADLRAEDADLPSTGRALSEVLPDVTHPGLLTGLRGVLGHAGRAAIRLADALSPAAAPEIDEHTLMVGLARTGLERYSHVDWSAGSPTTRPDRVAREHPRAHLVRVSEFFAGEPLGELPLPLTRLPWPALLGGAGAVARRAVSPAVGDVERAALLDLLDAWADTPFAADPTRFRVGRLVPSAAECGQESEEARIAGFRREHVPAVAVVERGLRYLSLDFGRSRQLAHGPGRWWIADGPVGAVAPDGHPVAVVHDRSPRWGTAERIRRFTALARERGPLPWRPDLADRLAVGTGLDRSAAAVLWATHPYVHDPGGREPPRTWPAAAADVLGVEPAVLLVGSAVLASALDGGLCGVLEAGMPDEPDLLWDDPEKAVDLLVEAWCTRVGPEVPVAPELYRVLAEDVQHIPGAPGGAVAEVLRAVARPDRSPVLGGPPSPATLVRGRPWRGIRPFEVVYATEPALGQHYLEALAEALPRLYADVPAGDPVRAGVPRAVELLRERLADDRLLVAVGYGDVYDDDVPWRPRLPAFGVHLHDLPGPGEIDGAAVVVCHRPADTAGKPGRAQETVDVFIRPAMVSDAELGELGEFLSVGGVFLKELIRLRGPALAGMAERIAADDLPVGGSERDPTLSAPELCATVAADLGLPTDAAALYLQLLALPRPTDRDVQRWNGWTAGRRRKAAAVLHEAGLVVVDKRPRAGRTDFVPGEWSTSGSGAADEMERYKNRLPAFVTLPELFRAAWESPPALSAAGREPPADPGRCGRTAG